MKGLDPRSVANLILRFRRKIGLETTHLEMQKLLYFCHGYFLSRYDHPLVDGYFEAWKDGPVHPYLYNVLRKYGSQPIVDLISDEDLITGKLEVVPIPDDARIRHIVGSIIIQLKNLKASQLRAKSHVPEGPWDSVMSSGKVNLASSLRIPDNVIRERYRRHLVTLVIDGPPVRGHGEAEYVHVFEDTPPERN